MDWIKIKDRKKPGEREKCLIAYRGFGGKFHYNVATYTKDLFSVDEFDFSDRKGKAGFYDYDTEWGWFEYLNVSAWIPIHPYEEKGARWIAVEHQSPVYDINGDETWCVEYECSACGFTYTAIEDHGLYQFCPDCGADMRGEGDG